VQQFVRAGWSLFVIVEYENIYRSSDFQNAVLAGFGLRFNNDFFGEMISAESCVAGGVEILNQRARSSAFGLNDVRHLLASSIGRDITAAVFIRFCFPMRRCGVKRFILAWKTGMMVCRYMILQMSNSLLRERWTSGY